MKLVIDDKAREVHLISESILERAALAQASPILQNAGVLKNVAVMNGERVLILREKK